MTAAAVKDLRLAPEGDDQKLSESARAAASELRAREAEDAVRMLFRTIERSVDAATPVAMSAIHGHVDVTGLLVLSNGATFERRLNAGQWTWLEVDAVPTTQIAEIRRLRLEPGAFAPTYDEPAQRFEMNQLFYQSVRHMLQAFAREQEARDKLAFIVQEEGGDFERSHGVTTEQPEARAALDRTTQVTDAAIVDFSDQWFDVLIRHAMGVTAE